VTVEACAVGDRDGSVRFSASGNSVSHVNALGNLEVRQVTLDGYCVKHGVNPTIMKVDIEGGEAAALTGSGVVRQLRELIVEIHEPALRAQGVDPSALLDTLGPYELLGSPDRGNYGVLVWPGLRASAAAL
jgi:hypothetical protein